MSNQSAIKMTVWLAIGLGLAACAAAADPIQPAIQPETPSVIPAPITPLPPTQSPMPANPTAVPASNTPLPPTATSRPAVILPDLGLAPDFTNEVWLNTDQPLNLASLQGQIVLVEFWTYG